jgi:hypothetical protein
MSAGDAVAIIPSAKAPRIVAFLSLIMLVFHCWARANRHAGARASCRLCSINPQRRRSVAYRLQPARSAARGTVFTEPASLDLVIGFDFIRPAQTGYSAAVR